MNNTFAPITQDELNRLPVQLKSKLPNFTPVFPVPDGVPHPDFKHYKHGKPAGIYPYRNRKDKLILIVCSYYFVDGDGNAKKEFTPFTYCKDDAGKYSWERKFLINPRPLYGLDNLSLESTNPILIVEGEKSVDAARELLPDYSVLTSSGGSGAANKSKWDQLNGRNIVIWPDNDEAGIKYGGDVKRLVLDAGALSVHIISPPEGAKRGWDAADALADGWTVKQAEELLRGAIQGDELSLKPIPLTVDMAQENPYPIDVFPEVIRSAVISHQSYTQQPMVLVAIAAMTQVSIACQGLADVSRNPTLINPISLFFIVVANSGERKSTADKAFGFAARQWEKEQLDASRDEMKEMEIQHKIWSIKVVGLESAIKRVMSTGDKKSEAGTFTRDLESLLEKEPKLPRLPRLIYEDANQQSLLKSLYANQPSAGVISDEGGVVTGAQGMNAENCLNYFATINKLWDGSSIIRDRATAGSFTLQGRRLTFAVMMQEAVLRKLISVDGGVSRSSGFLARMSLAAPVSTIGTRLYKEPPQHDYAMNAFSKRITELLNTPLPIEGDDARLNPYVLELSPEAKALWIQYFNEVEMKIAKHNELHSIPDFASKSADNATRIAACFHVFIQGAAGVIDVATMRQGIAIASWHLDETLRLFESIDIPQETTDAIALWDWLSARNIDKTTLTYIRNYAPNSLRSHGRHKKAVELLVEHNFLLPYTDEDKKTIRINQNAKGVKI